MEVYENTQPEESAEETPVPKYLILVAYVETQGEQVGQKIPGVWREFRDCDPEPVLFIDAPAAYKYAKDRGIDPCDVVKRHGTQSLTTKVTAQQELY